MSKPSLRLALIDKRQFFRKALGVATSMLILVPAVYYKLYFPAGVYLGGLLVLHLAFLYFYIVGVPWKRLAQNKAGLGVRVLGIALFAYLLALLSFKGSFVAIIISLMAALVLHLGILLFIMAEVKREPGQ